MTASFLTRTRANEGRTAPATTTPVADKRGLSTGVVNGIAIGGGIALISILVGIWLLIRKKRKSKSKTQRLTTADPPVQMLTGLQGS